MKKVLVCVIALIASFGIGIGCGFIAYKINGTSESPSNTNSFKKKIIKLGILKDEMIIDEYKLVTDYEEYSDFFGNNIEDLESSLKEKDFDNYDYLIVQVAHDDCSETNIRLKKYTIKKNDIDVDILYDQVCSNCIEINNVDYFALRLEKGFKLNEVNIDSDVDKFDDRCYATEDKPMIYIYPEKEMNVNIKLGDPNKIITSYPKYENGWDVVAKTDGTLKYRDREYYGLYWEGKNHIATIKEDGFVIKGEDTISFLEEKLAILGLNEREINEFVVYWLPKMEHNKYNYIRFETKEEIDNYMPLEISPKPDSIIRVYMDFKPLDKKINVKEQNLVTPSRTGYTVVEWGGSLIK